MRSIYALVQEISGMIASLQEIKLEFKQQKVDDLKSLEVAITMLSFAHEKLEVNNIDPDDNDKQSLC